MRGTPLPARLRERRDRLTGELVDMFLVEGFSGASVEDLARRLRCSKSTVYLIAPSKEQIVVEVVERFFSRAAERIEARVGEVDDPRERITVYLQAVAAELAPASPAFYEDVYAFEPAARVYEANTRFAAQRIQDFVDEGVARGVIRSANAAFVGAAVGQVMTAIQSGAIEAATGLDDAASYTALADLVTHGLRPDS